MHLLSAFLLAISCNVDNLAVAIAFGIKRLKIRLISNLLIAIVTAVATYISLSAGQSVRNYLPQNVSNLIGSLVIVATGIWIIWDTLEIEKIKKKKQLMLSEARRVSVTAGTIQVSSHHSLHDLYEGVSYETFLEKPEKADRDRSGCIDMKESIVLALGLSINNLGGGVGGGISGFHVGATTFLSLIFSIIAVTGGYFLGKRLKFKMPALHTGMLSGFLIIALGIYEHFAY